MCLLSSSNIFSLQDTRHLLNLGVLAELLHVSLVFAEVVPTDLARVPLATCAVEVVCLPQPRPGAGGTGESISTRGATPSAQPLLPLLFQPW